ncbi:cysteine peptidase family C39 domain-containing protein, partial [Neisseria meningitidis]|uniref:cysteine peptidase family C39 domain-containing protein n=2 Tax=Neisseria meningitidis TaxID=487 RepID=UPI000A6E8999
MDYLSRLSFGFNKKLPVILQTEVAECGLACLTSILSYYGFHTDLRTLRQKYTLSLKGANLADIMRFGNEMNLTPRALRLELDEGGFAFEVQLSLTEKGQYAVAYGLSCKKDCHELHATDP